MRIFHAASVLKPPAAAYNKVHRKIGHIYAAYADNFFLPFNLLAANTFLPPAVLILALNP